MPLYALESGDPIAEFDIIGFSLGYEMAYTNVLNMLDLAGLPLRSEDRKDLRPLVVAGGTSMYNPEPLAPFVDIVSLGEGEDVTVEMIQLYRKAKPGGLVQGTVASGGRPDSRALYSLSLRDFL